MKTQHKYKIDKETTTIEIIRRNGQKFEVMIDTEDLPMVLRHKWFVMGNTTRGVRVATLIKGKKTYLYHFLIGHPGEKMYTDHRDRNTLNNKKVNLFNVSASKNTTNRKITSKYGFPGLYFIPDEKGRSPFRGGGKPWQVRMRIKDVNSLYKNSDGIGTRLLYLGVFSTKEEAIQARRDAEIKYHGVSFH